MTEQTTTEILDEAVANADEFIGRPRRGAREQEGDFACNALCRLNEALLGGETLPEQWPQAKELVELRSDNENFRKAHEHLRDQLEKLRKALDDRRTVEGWVSVHSAALTFDCFSDGDSELEIRDGETGKRVFHFVGRSPDEAFSAAAEWVRRQG